MKSSPGEIAAPGTISITPVAATKTMAAPAATIPVATSSRRGLGKRDRSKNSASAQIINPVGIRTDGCIPVATITDALTTQAVPAVISSAPGTRPVTALMPKEYALRQAGHGVPPGPAAHFPVRPPKARMFHVPTVSCPDQEVDPASGGDNNVQGCPQPVQVFGHCSRRPPNRASMQADARSDASRRTGPGCATNYPLASTPTHVQMEIKCRTSSCYSGPKAASPPPPPAAWPRANGRGHRGSAMT